MRDQSIFSSVMILLILINFSLDEVLILLREYWHWPLLYPGYQRFFSRAAGIFGVGRRPKP